MKSSQHLQVGPITIRLVQDGPAVPLAGHYRVLDAPVTDPDAHIQAHLSGDFAAPELQDLEYPAFACRRIDDSTLAMSRLDACGEVRAPKNGPVAATFRGLAKPNTLEAIIRLTASIALPRKDALILHSSAVEHAGGSLVFSGVSGAGKSTIAEILSGSLPLRRLSDELLILSRSEGNWRLEVAPFTGKVALPWGESSPLRAIHFLEQAVTNQCTPLSPSQVMTELPRHVVTYAHDPITLGMVMELVGDLAEAIPCYHLKFSKSPSVAEVLGLTCS